MEFNSIMEHSTSFLGVKFYGVFIQSCSAKLVVADKCHNISSYKTGISPGMCFAKYQSVN